MAFIEKENKNLEHYRSRRIFTASARAAMTFILHSRVRTDSRSILLPAYIGTSKIEGSGVFDPIIATKIDFDFYPLDQRLQPDMSALEEKLKSGKFQLVLLIHYFGLPQVDIEQFVSLCRRYDVQLIEDCAHTLLGGLNGRRLGSFGDYAIFSIHKSTGTLDGGFLIDNTRKLDAESLPDEFCISHRTLIEFANTDIEASSSRRLQNYKAVAGWLNSIPQLKPMFDKIPFGAVPLNFPVIVGQGKREKLYFNLIERGIQPTALYHTLIPQITPNFFPKSHFVADNILNLPTHSDIGNSDLARYENTLRDAVKEVYSI